MVKAIIFDGGGVVVNQKSLMKKFIKIFKPKDKEQFLIELNRHIIPLCKNKISEKEFWEKFAKFIKIPSNKVPKNLWTKDYEKLTKIDKRFMQFIKNLRKNYKIGLISNTIKPHVIVSKKRGLFKI
mgnify:CR=1 FL=1